MMRIKLLLACFICLLSQSLLLAQIRGSNPQDDLDYYNQDRGSSAQEGGGIWWGTGGQLGFFSTGNQSNFTIGISPIAGYKVTPALSFGPRGSILYNSIRFRDIDDGANFFTYSAGVFGRVKAFEQFFAHVEYNLENEVIGLNPSTLDPIRRTRGVPYLGAGFSQGGGFRGGVGFELMILIPLREREFNDPPYIIRSGINVNF